MKMSILEYLYNTVTKLTLIKFPKSNAKLHPIVNSCHMFWKQAGDFVCRYNII